LFSSALHLFSVSLKRLFRSRQTLVCAMLLAFAAMAVFAWSFRQERTAAEFVERIFQAVFVTFLLPVYCLCYGAASIASERDDQTLVYLLTTPLPRPLIVIAKAAAAWALALGWSLGSLALLCLFIGQPGIEALAALWWPVALSATAYVMLFLLFSVAFRRATIIALAYAFFLEALIGNMPGIVKRLALSFYSRCLIFEAATNLGATPSSEGGPDLFGAVSAPTARNVLLVLTALFFVAGLVIFSRKEYAK